MNFDGIIIGAIMIAAIGFGHVAVVKWESYWGSRAWPAMLVLGLALVVGSLFTGITLLSAALGMFGATFLWGIGELIKQEQRVKSGQFPVNPKRKKA
jgi:hypothetical protein